MATIREITIDWQAAGSPGGTSVLHFAGVPSAAVQRSALFAALNTVNLYLAASTVARIATEGREFDDATGTLTGMWSEGTPYTTAGIASGEPVANAAQVLVRLATGAIVDGRMLKGRIFIPGLAQSATDTGQVSATAAGSFTTEFSDLAASIAELVVWSRPRAARTDPTPLPARPGSSAAVTGASTWTELAVLRRRR